MEKIKNYVRSYLPCGGEDGGTRLGATAIDYSLIAAAIVLVLLALVNTMPTISAEVARWVGAIFGGG